MISSLVLLAIAVVMLSFIYFFVSPWLACFVLINAIFFGFYFHKNPFFYEKKWENGNFSILIGDEDKAKK